MTQIATLRIIIVQSLEWHSSFYIKFVDYEKAFDNINCYDITAYLPNWST